MSSKLPLAVVAILSTIVTTAVQGATCVGDVEDKDRAKKEVGALISNSDFLVLSKMVTGWKKLPKNLQKRIIIELTENLHSQKELKLTNYADMFVLSRVIAKKMPYHGHGEEL